MAGESLIEQLRRREEQRRAAQGARAEGPPAAADAGGEPEGNGAPGAAGEEEVNTAAYGYFRGVHERAVYLSLQRLRDDWLAPGYAWLPCPVWKPSGGGKGRGAAIVLEYVTGLKVTIRGRNLTPLYDRLLRQQVFRVTEMGEEADRYLPEEATVVYAIEVAEPEVPKG